MEPSLLSRQYLESASTADLLSLADDYGIDIPDNLNRRFIIGELLELAEELHSEKEEVPLKEDNQPEITDLPLTYNETQICAIMRTPQWLFVYWDMGEAEKLALIAESSFKGFFLHAAFFDTEDAELPSDSFDIKINPNDREQYVLIPNHIKFCEISLNCDRGPTRTLFMAGSRRIAIPQENMQVQNIKPGRQIELSEQLKLSGMEDLLKDQYMNRREIF